MTLPEGHGDQWSRWRPPEPVAGGRARGRTQLRDEVATYIRELIVSGQQPPGVHLRLDPVAEALGVSITPVREALLLLVQDGWLVQEPNRGFLVARIRRRDIEDAFGVLAFTAEKLTRRAAAAVAPEAIERLRRINRQICDPPTPGPAEIEELNTEFHGAIYAAADSPRLESFASAAMRFVPRRFWGEIPGWLAFTRATHAPIVDALEARDAAEASRLVVEHLDEASRLLLTHLDEIGYWRDAPSED